MLKYLNVENTQILDIRGESLNIYVLLKAIFRGKLTKMGYIEAYIECVQPKIIITFIDNGHKFYLLKKYFPNIKTVFVQNGARSEILDVFKTLKSNPEFCVDYMLVFGNVIGKKYKQYIQGKMLPIGCFKNNMVPISLKQKHNSILFVSQFSLEIFENKNGVWLDSDGAEISIKEFFKAEEIVLKFIAKFCKCKNVDLLIAGRDFEGCNKEREYFNDLIGDNTWKYASRKTQFDNYHLLDVSHAVVAIDSTLGYESLARGNKTAMLSIRGSFLRNDAAKFGWPAKLSNNGPFWTNHADEREFERVMNYVMTVSDDEWEKTRQKYVPELIEFDPGNKKFLHLMKKLGVPLKENYGAYNSI